MLNTLQLFRSSIAPLAFAFLTLGTPASGQVINEDRTLTPAATGSGAFFGRSSAMDNGIVVVGADGAERAFTFDVATGAQLVTFAPPASSRSFGYSVDIQGNIVVIGARWDFENGAQSGAAYIFDATNGTMLHKLLPPDGAADYYFGYSIAIDGGIIAVGASYDGENGFRSGAAYLYNASNGVLITKILAPDGTNHDGFGTSIDIKDGIVAVGAIGDSDVAAASGSVYLFNAADASFIQKVNPTDPGTADRFGVSLSIDNGILAVGAYNDNVTSNDDGTAYLFDIATGTQLFKLIATDSAREDEFGWSIGIHNGIVVVGSHQDDDNGSLSGSAYLFDASTGTQIAKLRPAVGGASEYFGSSVAIFNGTAVGGSILFGTGSVDVFTVPTPPCAADLNNDGAIDFFDISQFLTDQIDWNEDTVFDFFDISGYLTAYGTGCP